MKNYQIYVVFDCFEGKREAFVEKVKAEGLVDAIRNEDGCIRYDFYFSEKNRNEILLIEEWESKEKQQIHINQPHMETFREIKKSHIGNTTIGEFETK